MSSSVNQLLDSFDHLPEAEKRELASEIIRRTAVLSFPPLSEDALVRCAEDVFLEMDRRESSDE